jgi:hypothetical protein
MYGIHVQPSRPRTHAHQRLLRRTAKKRSATASGIRRAKNQPFRSAAKKNRCRIIRWMKMWR